MKENEPHLSIREATAADASAIASVLHASFVEYVSSYTREAFTTTTPPQEQFQYRMSEGPVWVALQEEVIVGTVSAVLKSQGVYLRGMAILPGARGQNIGVLLLEQGERRASEHGAERMFLSTTPFLAHAIRLYERFGFRRSDIGPSELFGTPLFTMIKTLEPRQVVKQSVEKER